MSDITVNCPGCTGSTDFEEICDKHSKVFRRKACTLCNNPTAIFYGRFESSAPHYGMACIQCMKTRKGLNIECRAYFEDIDINGHVMAKSVEFKVVVPVFMWMKSNEMTDMVNNVKSQHHLDFLQRYITHAHGDDLLSTHFFSHLDSYDVTLRVVEGTVVRKIIFGDD